MNEQIVVDPNTIPSSISTLLRYALTALGTLMLTNNILPVGTDVETFVGIVLMVVSTGYGIYKTITNKRKLVVTANAAPDSVAVVKR